MPELVVKTKALHGVIFAATTSKLEFKFFKSSFKKLQQQGDADQIQAILDHWFTEAKISTTQRDILKGAAS